MLNSIRANDEIVITSLDRLSRNYKDLKDIIQIIKDKGAILTIVDAPFLNFNTNNPTLDTAMFDIFLSYCKNEEYILHDSAKEKLKKYLELHSSNPENKNANGRFVRKMIPHK